MKSTRDEAEEEWGGGREGEEVELKTKTGEAAAVYEDRTVSQCVCVCVL